MNFQNIHTDTTCNCLISTEEDNFNLYVRRINKPQLLEKDLKSHWEKGKRVDDSDCKITCSFKGISINLWNESSRMDVIAKFLTTFSISSKSKDSIYVFRFKKGSGVIKYTPNENDLFHYDFYKSDDFTADLLETIEITELKTFLT